MKYIKFTSLVGMVSILLFSCGKKSNMGRMIPKEATMVVDINAKSLLSKVSWEDIKKTYWYNEVMTDTSIPAKSKSFLEDPSKTGINLESDVVCFLLKRDANDRFVVEGNIKDGKLFTDHLKSQHPEGSVTKEGDLNIFKTPEAVVGWNADKFAMVTTADHHQFNGMKEDSTKSVPLPGNDDLVKVCKDLFALSNDNSLYENEKFAKLTGEDGDIHFWINANELYKGAMKGAQGGMAGMVKLDKFLVDNFAAITVNFEDGKISVVHNQYYGKDLSDILKKGEGTINTEMLKRLPSQNVAGVLAFHITPANLVEVIRLTGMDGFINLFMSQQGLSLEDAAKATKGDIVFSVSNITLHDTTSTNGTKDSFNYPKPNATFLFAVAIGDKDAFNKLIGMTDKLGKEEAMKSIIKKSDDKYFVVANSQDAVNKFLSGPGASPDYTSKLNDHPMGSFIDMQMIMKALQPEITKDSMDKVYYDRNITMWNNVYFGGGEYKDGGIVTHAEINMVDKSTNSLKQLNHYIDDYAKIFIERDKKRKAEWKSDSLTTKDTVVLKKFRHEKMQPHNKTKK